MLRFCASIHAADDPRNDAFCGVPTGYVCSVIDENGERDAVGALNSSEMGQTNGVTTQTLEKFINTLRFLTSKYMRR